MRFRFFIAFLLYLRQVDDIYILYTYIGIMDAFRDGKIATMIGITGGHSIDSRTSILRQYYELGVRYLTLTHNCSVPWYVLNM